MRRLWAGCTKSRPFFLFASLRLLAPRRWWRRLMKSTGPAGPALFPRTIKHDILLSLTATIFHRRRRKIMTIQSLIPLKARTGIAALAFAAVVMPLPAAADTFVFNTGAPDGLMATATRPASGSNFEIETGDDFVLTQPTSITQAAFTGLIPSGASITNVVVEVYHVFPTDSDVGRTSGPPTFSTSQVPTRVNSPADVEIAEANRSLSAGSLSIIPIIQNPTFTAANSVQPGGIHPMPGQTTGGNLAVTGQEVQINVNFSTPFDLPGDHYFFVPQVLLTNGGDFFWLSASRPITGPGTTPFPSGVTDLQAWTRDAALDPDWLRVGTDIVGGGATAPTFNTAFALDGTVVPEPTTEMLILAGVSLIALGWR